MTDRRNGVVAVFDAELPTGVSFIRSLGRLGANVKAYSSASRAAGRFSRYTAEFRKCPDSYALSEFISWLIAEYERGEFDYVAPTSDFITFVVAEVDERLGTQLSGGVGGDRAGAAVRDCLFKDRFSVALDEIGFPAPPWAAPTSTDDALAAARTLGYPVALKPRSHVGIGASRGVVAHHDSDVEASFIPYDLPEQQHVAVQHDPDLAYPLVQKLIERDALECISLSGCLDRDGNLLAVSASRKTDQWGTGLSIGTEFEIWDRPFFLDKSIDAVRRILGCGVFEFEVLVDVATEELWGLDLNPRAFGHIALDIGRGHDLPALWYASATGRAVDDASLPKRRPTRWRMGIPYYAGAAVRAVRGPGRVASFSSALSSLRRPGVGSVHAWADPIPGLALGLGILRHPGGLIRPFLRE